MRHTGRFTRKSWTPIVTASLLSLISRMPAAQAAPPACPLAINACGCVITQAAVYEVVNDLSASQTSQPNCIEIAAAHAILNLKGAKVLGNNNGIGILVDRVARSVIVEGGDEADNQPPQNPSSPEPSNSSGSKQAVVSQWNIGIEDDADNAVIELFDEIGGVALLPSGNTPGNTIGGVLLNGVKGSFIGDFRASFNGIYGVRLANSSAVHIANVTTQHNGQAGVTLESSNGNRIGPATAVGNMKYGAWLLTSSSNTIHDLPDASGNGSAGILVGCDLATKNCRGNQRSNQNLIVNSGAPGNAVAGIVIRKHSGSNSITVNHNDGNGGEKMDMVDENSKCDSNVWYNNTGSRNQSCIH